MELNGWHSFDLILQDIRITLVNAIYGDPLIMSLVDTLNFVVVVAIALTPCGTVNACSYIENSVILFKYKVMSELTTGMWSRHG